MTDRTAGDPGYNERQWDALAKAGVVCSRPLMDLSHEVVAQIVDPHGMLGDLSGSKVLCLANGGGRQSVAYASLGCEVLVLDHSEAQLEIDQRTAKYHHLEIRTRKGDIRCLESLDEQFDIVSQGYSLNYVPEVDPVFDGIASVLEEGGWYQVMFHNPVVHGSWIDGAWGSSWPRQDLWRGVGYPLCLPYVEGHPVDVLDPYWNFQDTDGSTQRIQAPQEYRHLLATILNGVAKRGFVFHDLVEFPEGDSGAEPGTWEHYSSVARPWMDLLCRLESASLKRA